MTPTAEPSSARPPTTRSPRSRSSSACSSPGCGLVWKEAAAAVHPDLQPVGYKILSALVHRGRLHAGAIADVLEIDKSVVSRQVQAPRGARPGAEHRRSRRRTGSLHRGDARSRSRASARRRSRMQQRLYAPAAHLVRRRRRRARLASSVALSVSSRLRPGLGVETQRPATDRSPAACGARLPSTIGFGRREPGAASSPRVPSPGGAIPVGGGRRGQPHGEAGGAGFARHRDRRRGAPRRRPRTIARPRPVLPARRERERVAAGEPLEERADELGRDAGAVVLDREHHVVAVALEHGDHARAVGRVHAGVREQVGDDLVQPGLVARHDGRGIRQPDLPVVVGAGRLRVADRLDDDAVEVDRSGGELATLVEPREQQQVLDELGHAHRLRLDAADGVHHVGRQLPAVRRVSSA